MIRKLQKRFIAIAILSVLHVLSILIGLINYLNYRSMIVEADDTLTLIASNNGVFPTFMGLPDMERPDGEFPEGEPPEGLTLDWFGNDGRQGRQGGFWNRRERSAELQFQTRYFTATFSEDGEILSLNTENIAALTESEAESLAASI